MNANIALGFVIPFLGTMLGAATVFFFRKNISDITQKAMLGFASGVMVAASFWIHRDSPCAAGFPCRHGLSAVARHTHPPPTHKRHTKRRAGIEPHTFLEIDARRNTTQHSRRHGCGSGFCRNIHGRNHTDGSSCICSCHRNGHTEHTRRRSHLHASASRRVQTR